jgi:Carboxypeptidase regulatory-like domain/TonB-dependent Receptor Plug Domain
MTGSKVLLSKNPPLRAVLLCVLVLMAPHLYAQRTTGDLLGVVRDASGAILPGVSVSVTGPNIAGAQTTITTENGSYRIGNLPPGTYTVTYELSGFKTVVLQGLRVNVGGALEQNVGLEIGTLAETVTVTGQSPIVDTTSSEVGTTFDKDWVENAPSRRYGFYDLLAQAPGTVKGGDGGIYSERRTQSFGSSFDENAFQLDGVNVTDNYWSEGFSEPNPDAVDEVEVLSLGAPAEYGNLMGAVYNIVTKQGTNQFHGDASYFFQSNDLTSNNTEDVKWPNGTFADACSDDPAARCPWTRGDYFEASAQLGGPIVRDRLWFFGSYGHQKEQYTRVGVNSNLPGSAQDNEKDRFLVKGTWQVTPSQRLVANFHRDKSPQDTGYSFNETPSTAWTRTQTAPTPGVAYTATLSNKTLLDVRYSGFYGGVTGYPSDPNEPLSQTRFNNGITGLISGANYYWYFYDASRTTVTGKLSHHADSFLGAEQDFHFGVQYNQAGVSGVYGYNDFIYTYLDGGKPYGYGKVRETFSYGATARNVGAFIDDSVRLGRVTLNLGVRFDHSNAFAPPQDELDDNAQPTGKTFPKADFFTWNSVSPRLGLNWKLTGDGKTVAKVHWGRYHPQITTGEFANIIGPNVKPYYIGTYNFATGEIEDLVLESSSENLGVSSDYHPPRTDQFIVGFERELNTKMGLQVNYVRKWGRDFGSWRDTVGTYVQVPVVDSVGQDPTGSTSNVFRLTSDPDARKYELGNSEDLFTDIHAVTVNLTKRMTRWYANAGVTYLRSTGALGGSLRTTSIQQRSALEFSVFGRNPNDYVNLDGRLVGDVGWQGKFQGVVRLGWGIQASASLDSREGAHKIRTRSIPSSIAGQSGTTILLQPRGDFGRLAPVTIIDARLQKDFRLGGSARIGVFMDALNLNNENAPQGVVSANVTNRQYQFPTTFVQPRRLMLSAKFSF